MKIKVKHIDYGISSDNRECCDKGGENIGPKIVKNRKIRKTAYKYEERIFQQISVFTCPPIYRPFP
jgi:hypothetical protein